MERLRRFLRPTLDEQIAQREELLADFDRRHERLISRQESADNRLKDFDRRLHDLGVDLHVLEWKASQRSKP